MFVHLIILRFLNLNLLNSISFQQLFDSEKKFYESLQTYWKDYNYLTPQWWLLAALTVISPILWCKLVDKKRILEITTFGLFYGVAATFLDSIGSHAQVWTYIVRLSPYVSPELYPYDVGVVIVPFMLVYQCWGKHLKWFLLFAGLLSFFLAFVAEPIMEWLKIYKEITWKHVYSFPIYWALSLLCWSIIKKIQNLEQRST